MFQRTKRQTGKQKVQGHGVSRSITLRSVKFNSFFVGHWLLAERQLGLLLLISYFVKEVSLATFFIHPLRRRSNEGNRQYGDPTHTGASEPLGSLISQNIFRRKHLILNCNFFCYFGISVVSKASLENTVFLLTYEKPYPPSLPSNPTLIEKTKRRWVAKRVLLRNGLTMSIYFLAKDWKYTSRFSRGKDVVSQSLHLHWSLLFCGLIVYHLPCGHMPASSGMMSFVLIQNVLLTSMPTSVSRWKLGDLELLFEFL